MLYLPVRTEVNELAYSHTRILYRRLYEQHPACCIFLWELKLHSCPIHKNLWARSCMLHLPVRT